METTTEPTDEKRLALAKQLASEADSLGRKSIEAWARCADEIEKQLADAKEEGRKLTQADVGRALGWPLSPDSRRPGTLLCRKVSDLLSWRRDSPVLGVDTHLPFGGASAAGKAVRNHARQITREDPDTIVEEAKKCDATAMYIRDALAKHLATHRAGGADLDSSTTPSPRPIPTLAARPVADEDDAVDDEPTDFPAEPTEPPRSKESARHHTFRETLRFAEEFAAQLTLLKFFKPADLTTEQQGILAAHLHDVQNLIAGLLSRLDVAEQPSEQSARYH